MTRFRAIASLILALLTTSASAQKPFAQTPEDFLEEFSRVVAGIADYQCRIADWSVYDGEEESRVVNFYFLRPRYMRMDIIIGTRFGDNGSRAVYLPNGKVSGKMKIFPFTRTMNVEHSLVTTIRGKSLEDTDLVGILEALRAHAAMGIVQIYRDEAAIVLDISYSEPSEVDELHREVIRFDLTSLLPVSADGFVSGNLVQHFVFDEYVINAGLPRELFNVRYDARDLSDDGIPTIANMPVRPVDVEESRYPVD